MRKTLLQSFLLSALMLLASPVWAETIATFNLGDNPGVSTPDGFFTHDYEGKWNFNNKYGGAEYEDMSFNKGLKIENTTKIFFTTPEVTTVTIVQSTIDSNTFRFDGNELAVEDAAAGTGCRIYTLNGVPAGDHTISRGSGETGLLYIEVSVKKDSEIKETTTTFNFEDSNNPFTDDSRITSAIEYDETLGSNVLGWTCANNAYNGYSFSHFDFSGDLVNNTEEVEITFDYYNEKGSRSILSIGDAGVRGNTGGSSKQTYNSSGAFFRIGSDKNNAFICGTNYSQNDICDKWVHVNVIVNLVDKNIFWDVYVWDEETKTFSFHEANLEDYYSEDCAVCSQIDVFCCMNNSHCCMIDNLEIKSKTGNYEHANYTIRYVDYEDNELKPSRVAEGFVDHPVELLPSDTENFYSNDGTKKYIFDNIDAPDVASDGSTVVTVFFREAEKYYAVLNCIIDGETMSTGRLAQFRDDDKNWFFEGDNFYISPAIVYAKDGKYYKVAPDSYNGKVVEFPGSISPVEVDGKTYYVGSLYYTPDETIAYYSEFERLALPTVDEGNGTGLGQLVGTVNSWWCFLGVGQYFDRFSQGRGIRLDAGSYVWTEPIAEDGTYMVRIYGRNDKSANCEQPYALGYRDAEGNVTLFDVPVPDWASATTGESVVGAAAVEADEEHDAVKAAGIGLKAGWSLVVKNTGNGSMISLDDVTLTKVADYAETPTIHEVSGEEDPVKVAPEGWTSGITNGNLAGDDVSSFVMKEYPSVDIVPAAIVVGAGTNGSRGILVKAGDDTENKEAAAWDSQFWIVLDDELPSGTKLHVEFDYKASQAAKAETMANGNPGVYHHYAAIGDVNFTTEWQHFSADVDVNDAMAKGDNGNGSGTGLKSIGFCLQVEKSATDYYFDNFGVWYQKSVVLMAEATALAADDEAVAVGKLREAIQWAKDNSDESKLQAAIDQFKADNADQEKDETAKVAINGWKDFNGNPAGVCQTQYAPAITTYNGLVAQLAEVYEGSTEGVNRTGTIIYQDITGLTNGTYKVGFYGNAFFTSGRGFDSPMFDGADDVAYVFANEAQAFITAHVATATTENDFRQFDVEVIDGNIRLGMGKAKAGTNWHTMQIYQLTWFTTAKEAYASCQEDLAALVAEAKTLAADETKTNGRDEFIAVLEAAEFAVGSNWYNIPEVEALIASLKSAIGQFKHSNYYIDFAAGEYYIIDAESGLMMSAGHDWGTQGIVDELGLDLTLMPDAWTRTVTIDSRVSNGGNQHYLGSNLYMDSDEYGWFLDYQGFGFYITNGEGQYINIDGENNLVMSDMPREWIIVTKAGVMWQHLDELEAAALDNPVDATFLIKAPNFNRNDQRNAEVWNVSTDCTNHNLSGGNNVNNCAESYHSTFTISQILTDAPAGLYQLTAQGFYRQEDGAEEDAPVFFIGSATGEVPVIEGSENSMADASESFTAGLYTIKPISFYYDGESSLIVGIQGTALHQWVAFDNFQLAYLGKEKDDGTVKLPKGLEIVSYGMIYKDYSDNDGFTPVNVAVDGNDVYFQGLSEYLPKAWVKGTKDGNTVTFPAMQYMGEHDVFGSSFYFYNGDAVFTYDAKTESYSAEGEIYGIIGDIYYDRYVFNPVIRKVVDMAAMPANPEIIKMKDAGYYGWYFDFNVPPVDINDNPLVTSKLAYKIYSDTKGVVEALTFTPATHSKLAEDMTEIPYGFTDSWDFYPTQLYLNGLYSEKWDKIGIQSIYYGGGEVNTTEIQWYDLRLVRAPEDLATETYGFSAYDTYYSSDVTGEVQVGFYGENDVYIQGLSKYLPKAWVKGKLVDGTLTIPQTYLGVYTDDDEWTDDSDVFFTGTTFFYNEEAGTFYSDGGYVTYESPEAEYYMDEFKYVLLTKLLDVAAIPANPEIINFNYLDTDYPILQFEIPTVDINGNSLIKSKLAYQIYYFKNNEVTTLVLTKDLYPELDADMTEIPYGFKAGDIYPTLIYLNQIDQEIDSWQMIGIQSIYYGGYDRNISDIVWFTNDNADGIRSVDNAKMDNVPVYNLAGQRIDNSQFTIHNSQLKRGIYIVNGKKITVK